MIADTVPGAEVTTQRAPSVERVRHGFHPCQREQAIQTARCGYQRLGDKLGVPTPPANACVVCMDMRSQPCPFCGRRG